MKTIIFTAFLLAFTVRAQIVYDTFTGADSTALTSHTGETGATWTKHTSYAAGAAVLLNNKLSNSVADLSVFYASGTPATAEYDVAMDISMTTSNQGHTVAARINTAANTLYYAGALHGAWQIVKVSAGSASVLGSGGVMQFVNPMNVNIRLAVRGSSPTTLTLYTNGVQAATATDSSSPITAAGKAGVLLYLTSASTVDNFGATNYVAATTKLVSVNDTNIYWSKNWQVVSSDFAQTAYADAYLKCKFLGTSAYLNLTNAQLSGVATYPIVKWSIDGGAWQSQALSGTTSQRITLGSGLADTTHTLRIATKGFQYDAERWSSNAALFNVVRVTSLEVDIAAHVTNETVYPDVILCVGDSLTEGINNIGASFNAASQDGSLAWPALVGAALNSEYVNLGRGSRSFSQTGAGGVPQYTGKESLLWTNTSLDLSQFTTIICLLGTGTDGGITVGDPESTYLTWRQSNSTAHILQVCPTMAIAGSTNRLRLTNAVASRVAAGDSRIYFATLPAQATEDLDVFDEVSRFKTGDNIHWNAEGMARVGSAIAAAFRQATSRRESASAF